VKIQPRSLALLKLRRPRPPAAAERSVLAELGGVEVPPALPEVLPPPPAEDDDPLNPLASNSVRGSTWSTPKMG
jgi:hypothetical protein